MFQIGNRKIGLNYPTYFIAELSCNHNGSLEKALELIKIAKTCGADAIKTQTYTADTITLNCDNEYFRLNGTQWDNHTTLWNLLNKAHTPWEWLPVLKEETIKLGMDFFSTPFDNSAVDFLEQINVPVYKIASMEIVDIPLIKKIAKTGKPVIMSTGMASLGEIEEAINTLKSNGCPNIALLKCTSAYPAKPENANLITIKHLSDTFNVVGGLSDHTLGTIVPITAYALGARIIEKHFTISRTENSPDASFSLEPSEFKEMVDSIRIAEKAIGKIRYGGTDGECKEHRRSLFVVKDMSAGDIFIENINVKSIRPCQGLHTKYLDNIIGKKARCNIVAGTPLSWDLIL